MYSGIDTPIDVTQMTRQPPCSLFRRVQDPRFARHATGTAEVRASTSTAGPGPMVEASIPQATRAGQPHGVCGHLPLTVGGHEHRDWHQLAERSAVRRIEQAPCLCRQE
jgi:hypothetical protein